MMREHELPPGFVPDPPFYRWPSDVPPPGVDSFEHTVFGSGKLRWCACRAFGIYRGSGKFGRVIQGGETISLEVIRPNCDSVTRKVFAQHHSEWVMDLMAQAEGFGYPGVFMDDPHNLMKPLDVVVAFGLNVPDHFYRKRDRTAASVLKRAERYAALAAKKRKSQVIETADAVARLI